MALGANFRKSGNVSSGTEQLAADCQGETVEGIPQSRGSRIMGAILSPAVQLWLRSQVQHLEELTVKIEGSDRQLLHGAIPKVSLTARDAVYQGLHLTSATLAATSIRVNLGQVLKGKPLHLLAPVPVIGEVRLSQTDLNASLNAPLLTKALSDFLLPLLPNLGEPQEQLNLQNPQMTIDAGQLTLVATILLTNGTHIPFVLQTGLRLANGHELWFEEPDVQISQGLTSGKLENFQLDLGPEVKLEELTLRPGELVCRGEIQVNP